MGKLTRLKAQGGTGSFKFLCLKKKKKPSSTLLTWGFFLLQSPLMVSSVQRVKGRLEVNHLNEHSAAECDAPQLSALVLTNNRLTFHTLPVYLISPD